MMDPTTNQNDYLDTLDLKKEKQLPPMGGAKWKAHGQKYGYWKYFEKEFKQQLLKELPEQVHRFIISKLK